MRRYLFDNDISLKKTLRIDGELFKHIFTVCRRSVGDHFELLTRDGQAYLVQVSERSKNSAVLMVEECRDIPPIKKPYIHLVLANPRPSVFEGVIEKAVELGVKSIYPITTENSFLKNVQKLKAKEGRIQKIIKQAMQQTGRFEGLDLKPMTNLEDFLALFKDLKKTGGVQGSLFYEAAIESKEEVGFKANELEDVFILIGGEGGFLQEEASAAVSAGFKAHLLGEQILRVETACVASISILKSKLGIW